MPTPWSRRGFVKATGGAAAALGLAGAIPVTTASGTAYAADATDGETGTATASADEFDHLRSTWRGLILGAGFSPTAEPFASKLAQLGTSAAAWRTAMSPTAGSLWPQMVWLDPEPDTDTASYTYSAQIQLTLQRLRSMAEAYAQPGTGLTGDTGYARDVVAGLRHVVTDVYHAGQAPYGNWYNWQIGGPQALLDAAIILHDHVDDELRAAITAAVGAFVPDSAVASYSGTSTGANRVDLCRTIALSGLVGADAGRLSVAAAALSPVFPYVTSGDGLYRDGSFVQHTWVPYAGSYGADLFSGLSLLFALLAGSRWEITDPARENYFDAVERAWAPFLFNGLCMDAVSGRAISRGVPPGTSAGANDDHLRGHAIIASIVALGRAASAEQNARWRALAKGWVQRAYFSAPHTDPMLGVYKLAQLQEVANDSTVKPLPEPLEHRLFPSQDRAVHRRTGWAACLSMASERIAHYEWGNGENLRGWHTGAGWLSWWGDDFGNEQYSQGFWATVDPYRLPGTTVSRKRLADGEGGQWGAERPDARWVGGTTDGTYAAVGQHLKGLSSTLEARKSWFFLDEGIVCLGAGITAADGQAVDTVVDNRRLGGDGAAALTVDGRRMPGGSGWTRTFTDPGWAHLAGHGGYVFPEGGRVTALREERTGRWSDIRTGSSTEPVTDRYLTLYVDHGTDPVDAGYAYVLLPGAGAARTASRAAGARGLLRTLVNTPEAQGVHVPSLGVTAVNFWAEGSAAGLTVSAPCSVLVRHGRGGTATVCVADPTRELTALTVTWDHRVTSVVSRPGTVRAASTGRELKLTFGSLTAEAGATQKTTVRTA
ncbi:polysaccharide lyase 8 family protein [Streptomyces griseoviridis]|uniref:Hyaluronate lyase n=1 Tax=Streptomyces griseoviridis TaxID=45398 RepID=A0ABT9L738_STRGD|nr:polysaccharide lyase 8 family protein [Streptomyces griseoviridis]MDP9679518.1 hyaluronate lyase [Streptomyces griseoviridis]GGT00573.1 lyase [Streptomyces griseoviridis]